MDVDCPHESQTAACISQWLYIVFKTIPLRIIVSSGQPNAAFRFLNF